jgi:antitoxin (DNA-binding transcriptional repressor) of toxin-antitoxin stability system
MPDHKTVTFDALCSEIVESLQCNCDGRDQDGNACIAISDATAIIEELFERCASPTPAAQSAGQEAVAWRDAIDAAVQVLSHIEAGDDVFVGQASEAIAGLTAILRAPSIPPTFEQARDALCNALDAYPPKRIVAPVNSSEPVAWFDPTSSSASDAFVWEPIGAVPSHNVPVYRHAAPAGVNANNGAGSDELSNAPDATPVNAPLDVVCAA